MTHLCVLFSLSALIENKIFSVHGGLSPAITTLDQVSYPLVLFFFCVCVVFVNVLTHALTDKSNRSQARSTS